MNNLLKFPKPANQDKKCNSPTAVRIMVFILILLATVKLFGLDDFRPSIYRQHDVFMMNQPIKLPENYLVTDFLSGKEIKISDALGDNITILAFWATWCGYCAKEFPEIDALVPSLASQGIKILPVARGDDTTQKVQQFLERGNIKNLGTTIATTPELHKALKINAYPSFIAVDKNGFAFAKLHPRWEAENINELFEKIISEHAF